MRLPTHLLSSKTSKLTKLLLTMPKSKPHLPILKAVRKSDKLAKTMTKYPPGLISLQVLGNSLYLFTDQSRYLFNCSEGTQRLAHEHKLKLAKLDHVFLTSGRWERVGGLPGVALTVQDIGVERVWVHGPPGVNRLFTTTRRFIILKDLEISTVNTCASPLPYHDHILDISYINISDGSGDQITPSQPVYYDDNTDYYSNYRKSHGEKMISVKGDESVLLKNVAVQYGIRFKAKEGQLLIDKCVALGVPPGPLLGRLKAGEDVVLGDGRTVKAGDVRAGEDGGAVVLVLDCPTLAHLPAFLSNKELASYHTDTAFTHTVVHFTPLDILQSPDYRSFLSRFPLSTNHLIINQGVLSDAHEAVHRMQTKLNVIDPELFPMFPIREKKTGLDLGVKTVIGETGMRIGIRGGGGVEGPTWTIDPPTYRAELLSSPAFTTELEAFKKSQPPKKTPPSPAKLLFLGTGSSIPNKTRNVSSFYLQIDENSAMLFDCGEGSLQQLQRFAGWEKYLEKLKVIWISHLHADHHLGLFSFLKLKKLVVIAPKQIGSWLASFSRDFDHFQYELLPADGFLGGRELPEFGISQLTTCPVRHCPNSFGVSVVIRETGKKLTYSGDTLPCQELVALGKDSDILVHEATMEDGLEKEALGKMHSTCGQALGISEQMGAKFLILTHFSQRYSKIPMLEGVSGRSDVGVAFDGLVVGVDDVGRMGGMGGVLSEGWREDVEEMEGRRVKRGRREELMKGEGVVAVGVTV